MSVYFPSGASYCVFDGVKEGPSLVKGNRKRSGFSAAWYSASDSNFSSSSASLCASRASSTASTSAMCCSWKNVDRLAPEYSPNNCRWWCKGLIEYYFPQILHWWICGDLFVSTPLLQQQGSALTFIKWQPWGRAFPFLLESNKHQCTASEPAGIGQ